jgi:hypothetical protein
MLQPSRKMKQHGQFRTGLFLSLLLLVSASELFGQSSACTAKEQDAALPPDAQIYAGTMELSRLLSMNYPEITRTTVAAE